MLALTKVKEKAVERDVDRLVRNDRIAWGSS